MVRVGGLVIVTMLCKATAGAFVSAPDRRDHHRSSSGIDGKTCPVVLSLFRQANQYQLEQIAKTGMVKVNGKQVEPNEAVRMMEQEMQAIQEDILEAEDRRSTYQEQLQTKVMDKTANVQAMHYEMNMHGSHEQPMAIAARIKSHQESVAAVQHMRNRDARLGKEVEYLALKIQQEENRIRVNHEIRDRILDSRMSLASEVRSHMTQQRVVEWSKSQAFQFREELTHAQVTTNRVLQKRAELHGELEALKRRYDVDNQKWERKLLQEVSLREQETQKAKEEAEQLRDELQQMIAQFDEFRSHVVRSMVMVAALVPVVIGMSQVDR